MAVSISQFIQICFAFSEADGLRSGKVTRRPAIFLRCGRGSCEIGIPHVGGTFPISIGLFFPDLEVFPAIVNRLTARVVHRRFVRAAHPRHLARLADLHSGRLPGDDEAGTGEHLFPAISNRLLRRCARRVWRKHDRVIRIVSDCLLDIFSCCSFRPFGIEITKKLLDRLGTARFLPKAMIARSKPARSVKGSAMARGRADDKQKDKTQCLPRQR